MLNDICYGSYVRFATASKEEGAAFMGADNLVGDIYTIDLELQEDRSYRAWLVNRFGARVAFLEDDQVHRVQTLTARGWAVRALLSFVALDDQADGYWGEMALLANDPHYTAEFDAFALKLREKMAEGLRPEVDFNEQAARKIIDSKGSWEPTGRVPMPKFDKHSAVVKSRRSASEKLVEQGRQGNKGCYAASIVIWVVIAAAVIAGICKLLGLF